MSHIGARDELTCLILTPTLIHRFCLEADVLVDHTTFNLEHLHNSSSSSLLKLPVYAPVHYPHRTLCQHLSSWLLYLALLLNSFHGHSLIRFLRHVALKTLATHSKRYWTLLLRRLTRSIEEPEHPYEPQRFPGSTRPAIAAAGTIDSRSAVPLHHQSMCCSRSV